MFDDHGFELPDLGIQLADLVVLLARDLPHLFVNLLHNRHLELKKIIKKIKEKNLVETDIKIGLSNKEF